MSNELLRKLAKEDSRWRVVAFKLCGSKELADDLVQDMYLKCANYEDVNSGFVYKVLRNLFLAHVKKKQNVRIEELHYLEYKESTFEPSDYEQDILNKFDELYWTDQDLIRERYDRSLRQIQEAYPMIHFCYAHRQITKSIKEILGDDFDTHYNNKNNKRNKK